MNCYGISHSKYTFPQQTMHSDQTYLFLPTQPTKTIIETIPVCFYIYMCTHLHVYTVTVYTVIGVFKYIIYIHIL